MKHDEAISVIRTAKDKGAVKFRVMYAEGNTEMRRLFVTTDGQVCEFAKGKRNFGYPLHLGIVSDIVPILPRMNGKSDEERFDKCCEKILKHLDKDGLWPELREKISYTKRKGFQYYLEHVKKHDDVKLIGEYDADWILGCKIVKMNFGKYYGDMSEDIKRHIEEKHEFQFRTRANYDVSFHYTPEGNRAWYSLEYKNCGNGHYYLALNGTHAIFYEDD